MDKFVIATWGEWNVKNYEKNFSNDDRYILIKEKHELTQEYLEDVNPKYVFFPHWSHIIPKSIYENFECVVFHMTDLPYGRGGSPLQNLIVNGQTETKISAIKVVKELDAGPVYFKLPLSLEGTAQEIYTRASSVIFEKLIPMIVTDNPQPVEQVGEVFNFKRRKPEDGNLENCKGINQIYDYIRMLDAEGYPNAFLEFKDYVLTFKKAQLLNGEVKAEVIFKRKED
ncbi:MULTISPECIES: formyltransferase family protein [unclassified Halobacteriovorax]|uniref:formyltransferase family protein n=1 Tax=unclassified Halobacteriovorax TaxID=2639665 RepID=UPI00399B8550